MKNEINKRAVRRGVVVVVCLTLLLPFQNLQKKREDHSKAYIVRGSGNKRW